MEIKLFGVTKDLIGKSEIKVPCAQGMSVETLRRQLEHEYPRLQDLPAMAIAINCKIARVNYTLNPEDEIALIPPVSGG